MALVVFYILDEAGVGNAKWLIAILSFMGASGATIGVGFLVITVGQILEILKPYQQITSGQTGDTPPPPSQAEEQAGQDIIEERPRQRMSEEERARREEQARQVRERLRDKGGPSF